MSEPITILPQHSGMLAASAIAPEVIAARGYRSVQVQAQLKRLGFSDVQRLVPTLLVPIWNVNGEIGLYHHRPDAPRIREGKIVKYEFPAGKHMVVDVHPFIREKVRDPKVPLFITEGVKKADAAISIGLCCLGVIGTWNWRGTNEHGGKTVLPDWDGIALKDREDQPRDVYIVYDSDVMLKRQVHQALVRLADFLKSRGARVHFIYLPHGSDGSKLGLDDYLALGRTVEDLMALATTKLREPVIEDESLLDGADHPYEETPGGLIWHKPTGEGTARIRLTNFTARIVADEMEDDGIEVRRTYEILASLNGRTEQFTIPAASFPMLNWASEHLGIGAIVEPGIGLKDRARASIQSLSMEAVQRRVYTHIGWRQVAGRWAYLHGVGAIGADVGETVSVRVQRALRNYVLPDPPRGDDLVTAVRASLGLLDLGSDTVTMPAYAATFRAVLDTSDFSLHFSGQTGVYKSELAALCQQHFGQAMDARHFPADWSSTDNYLEALAFHAKDAILTIDELVPRGSGLEIQKLWAKVDRVLRGQGNNAGRGRMRADGTLPPPKPPRGTILSTGEEVPPGHSLNARIFVVEVSEGDLQTDRLSVCQRDAAEGLYAQCMAGYLEWLAPRFEEVHQKLKTEVRAVRDKAAQDGQHRRTSGIVADLTVGFQRFLEFAEDVGAITEQESAALAQRAWKAIEEVAEQQTQHQAHCEPTRRFLDLLSEALASGKAHLASLDGNEPDEPVAWGWRSAVVGPGTDWERIEWRAQGDRVGWIEGDDVYLLPDPAYQCAKRLGGETGEGLAVRSRTLNKRLRDRRLLASHGGRRGAVIRKTAEGRRQDVLHLSASRLTREETAQTAQTDHSRPNEVPTSADPEPTGPQTWAVSPQSSAETSHQNGPEPVVTTLVPGDAGQNGPFGPLAAGIPVATVPAMVAHGDDANTPLAREVFEL